MKILKIDKEFNIEDFQQKRNSFPEPYLSSELLGNLKGTNFDENVSMLMAQNFPALRTTVEKDGLGYKNADPKFMTT